MPFEKGNQLGAKSRLFDGALRRTIAQDTGDRLRQAAEQLLNQAAAGEPWAIKEIADRLDGKPQQNVSIEKKDVRELSLSELMAELAATARDRGPAEDQGADESSRVH